VQENKVFGEIFGPKWDEVKQFGIFHSKYSCDLNRSTGIVRIMRSETLTG